MGLCNQELTPQQPLVQFQYRVRDTLPGFFMHRRRESFPISWQMWERDPLLSQTYERTQGGLTLSLHVGICKQWKFLFFWVSLKNETKASKCFWVSSDPSTKWNCFLNLQSSECVRGLTEGMRSEIVWLPSASLHLVSMHPWPFQNAREELHDWMCQRSFVWRSNLSETYSGGQCTRT